MASEEDLDLNPEEEESAAGGNKKLIIIVAAAVLLIGGGAAAFFLMGGEESAEESVEQVAEAAEVSEVEEQVVEGKGEAIYVSVPNGILAQLQSGKRKITLQIQVDMRIRNPQDREHLIKHMPLIENDLLMFFSSANAKEIQSPEGKTKLRQGALKIIQGIMQKQTGKPVVEIVLFPGFVMQR